MAREYVVDQFDGPLWELAIYRTDRKDQNHGSAADITLADYVHQALVEIDINHRIRYDFDTTVPIEYSGNSTAELNAFGDWLGDHAPFVGKDSNLLCTMVDGGGRAYAGGTFAIMGMGSVDSVKPRRITDQSRWHGQVYGAMHEIGHNMGFHPDQFVAGVPKQHGMTWVLDGIWQKTPCIGRRDATENVCGETMYPDPDPNAGDVTHNYYHWCVAEQMKIREPPGHVRITSVTVSPSPAEIGETVAIEATMENTTTSRAQRDEPVLVEHLEAGWDRVIDTLSFDVASGASQTLSTTFTPDEIGEHLVQVNQGVVTFDVEEEIVEPPPEGDLRVESVSVDPEPSVVGEESTIAVVGRNYGDGPVDQYVDVVVRDVVIGEVRFTMDGAGTNREYREQTSQLTWVPQSAGQAQISAGDVTTSVAVDEPTQDPPDPPDEPDRGTGDALPVLAAGAGLAAFLLLARPDRRQVERIVEEEGVEDE